MPFIVYIIWTFCCSVFLKIGIDGLTEQSHSYKFIIPIVIFVQICVTFPIFTAIGLAIDKITGHKDPKNRRIIQ